MTKTLVVALILISVCVSKNFDGYMINYQKSGSMKFQKDQEQYVDTDLASLFKNNIGALETNPSEQAQKLIHKYGKGNLLNPLQMNYMFIVEGLSNEAAKRSQVSNTVPVSFELNQNNQSSLLDEIFDSHQIDSVSSQVNKFFDLSASRAPFFIYSSNEVMTKYFKRFGMSLNVRKTGEVDLFDNAIGKNKRISPNIEQCVNEVYGKKYALRLKEGYIYKVNTNIKLKIDASNLNEIEGFLKDVCGVRKLSQKFRADEQPTFTLFYIDSIGKLEQKLNSQDFNFVLDMFNILMEKAVNGFGKRFKDNVLGQVLFIDETESSYLIANEKTGTMTPSAILAQMDQVTIPKKRRLSYYETMGESTFDQYTYQIFCWFIFFFILVLYYVCMKLYTMNVGKDSLLYAKYIVNDARG